MTPRMMVPSNLFVRLSERGVPPIYWVTLSLICMAVDYVSGPVIQFPVVYLVPISLAAWYGGRSWGLALAFLLPLFRLAFRSVWDPPWTWLDSSINAAIRMTVFASFVWLIDRTSRQMRDLRRMRLLEGILGVCGLCKQIHDQRSDVWRPLEAYVADHAKELRPDLCPGCAKHVREVVDRS